jgi:hypothetical protein
MVSTMGNSIFMIFLRGEGQLSRHATSDLKDQHENDQKPERDIPPAVRTAHGTAATATTT